jgi:hypothetical protein
MIAKGDLIRGFQNDIHMVAQDRCYCFPTSEV